MSIEIHHLVQQFNLNRYVDMYAVIDVDHK